MPERRRASRRLRPHDGDFFGLAPTGRTFEVAQMTIERFRDGRIIAHHRLTDEASLMRQLTDDGAAPSRA
ncbi:MAG: hypothetical protein BGO98_32180 [Myxococcales bacterium 68-20]|nr:MAG: hypothetical protein BGO98_32180 [Myxococcales bacterium 68-20]